MSVAAVEAAKAPQEHATLLQDPTLDPSSESAVWDVINNFKEPGRDLSQVSCMGIRLVIRLVSYCYRHRCVSASEVSQNIRVMHCRSARALKCAFLAV